MVIFNSHFSTKTNPFRHRLRTPRNESAFTAWPKTQSQSQISRYGGSIFCLPHRPNFSDIFDLCLHWVSVVRECSYSPTNTVPTNAVSIIVTFLFWTCWVDWGVIVRSSCNLQNICVMQFLCEDPQSFTRADNDCWEHFIQLRPPLHGDTMHYVLFFQIKIQQRFYWSYPLQIPCWTYIWIYHLTKYSVSKIL